MSFSDSKIIFSDGRFKVHVQENVPGLDFIMNLRPVTYQLDINAYNSFIGKRDDEHIDDTQNTQLQTGFIAQEIETVAKEMNYDFSGVDVPTNDKDAYGLRYAQFVTPIIKAMQEQQELIIDMQSRIDILENIILESENDKK